MIRVTKRVWAAGAVGAIAVGTVGFWSKPPAPPAAAETVAAPVLATVYAQPLDVAETVVLGSGQTLSELLGEAGVGSVEQASLMLVMREHQSPRRLRPGTEVTLSRWIKDHTLRAVDLQINADSALRLERDEMVGWRASFRVTPVVWDTVTVAGVIEDAQSLYQSLLELDDDGVPIQDRIGLVTRLARIFEYRLDFLHDIQAGDHYRFVYEREGRPDGTARGYTVLAAEFVNRERPFQAIRFELEDRADYFDPEGQSLRTAFKRYPLDYVRVTSNFSWRRYHPVLGIYRAHVGTDFGARSGTPVLATGSGIVDFAGRKGGYGNIVILRHPAGYTTRYAHLRGFARGIRRGARVEQGQVIGYVGATGTATAAHLHYEFRQHGKPVNPRTVVLPSAEPIPDEAREAFDAARRERTRLLPGPSVAAPPALVAMAQPAGGAARP
jgi:murein DD-endopeptidase MepM/ murein hydrolase activator NlpD